MDCNTIVPQTLSDCALSTADKTNYQYCCYTEFANIKRCEAYDESGKQKEEAQLNAEDFTVTDFKCNSADLTSKTRDNSVPLNCESIIPKKTSDCSLPPNDVNNDILYCCFYDGYLTKDSESIKESEEWVSELNKDYFCNDKNGKQVNLNKNKSEYLKGIFALYLVLIMVL